MNQGIEARNAIMCLEKPKQFEFATASNVWQGAVGKA